MQDKNKIWMYSAFSGTFYEVLESDLSKLDEGQIPLKRKPSNCNKCFGRGHNGRDTQSYHYVICNCIRKAVNPEKMKNAKNITIG